MDFNKTKKMLIGWSFTTDCLLESIQFKNGRHSYVIKINHHINGFNSVTFTLIELKFGMLVAKACSQHRGLT